MPFISEPLDDVHEPQPAPEAEYELRIAKAVSKESKSGEDMAVLTFVFTDPSVDAPPFNHWLLGWANTDDDSIIQMRKLEFKRFCACFDLPEDFEIEDCIGQTGTTFVAQEVGDDDVVRNRAKFPKLKE